MVVTLQETRIFVGEDGTLSIPEEVMVEIGAKPGDTVWVSVDDKGVARVRRVMTVAELAGSLPPLKEPVDDDFGNVIRESQEEWAEGKMRRYGLKA